MSVMSFYDSKYHPSPFYSMIPTCIDAHSDIFFNFFLFYPILSLARLLCSACLFFFHCRVVILLSLCPIFASICLSIVMTKNDGNLILRSGESADGKGTTTIKNWQCGGRTTFEEDR